MIEIREGQKVLARTSGDRLLLRRAASGIVQGDDFPVIWVCKEEEWADARRASRIPDAVPWPANAVSLAPSSPNEPEPPLGQSPPDAPGSASQP